MLQNNATQMLKAIKTFLKKLPKILKTVWQFAGNLTKSQQTT